MSRKIDITKPLSDEDIAYLKSRGREYDIARNAEFVSGERVGLRGEDPQDQTTDLDPAPSGDEDGDSEKDETSTEDESDSDDTDLSLDELKALAKAKGLPVSGSKSDLKERLAGA